MCKICANLANKSANIATKVQSAVINVHSYLLKVQLIQNPLVQYLGQSCQSLVSALCYRWVWCSVFNSQKFLSQKLLTLNDFCLVFDCIPHHNTVIMFSFTFRSFKRNLTSQCQNIFAIWGHKKSNLRLVLCRWACRFNMHCQDGPLGVNCTGGLDSINTYLQV